MGNIFESFCQTFGIEEDSSRKRDEHYQLTGSKNERIRTYTDKISTVFTEHEVFFLINTTNELESNEVNENADTPETETKDDVYNVLTKKVLPDKMAETFIKVEEIGEKRYKSFIADKLEGEGSIWDTIKKEKITTFVINNRSTTVMIDNRLVTIREERKLMNRLLVASRTRPDIDLCECLGTYEFTVTPPSLFCPDGTMHPTNDKSVIAEQLFQLQADSTNETPLMENVDEPDDTRKVIIIDGMAVVNRVDIKKRSIKSCADFAKCFLDIIDKEATDFDEV
ncbi:uncharacterized protein [Clytia hemisphaerica]|uniref:uncharacterized protein n=1 Tax=Clytia hemisphaerica TaxID=252671 RepID=UPI0034D5D550